MSICQLDYSSSFSYIPLFELSSDFLFLLLLLFLTPASPAQSRFEFHFGGIYLILNEVVDSTAWAWGYLPSFPIRHSLTSSFLYLEVSHLLYYTILAFSLAPNKLLSSVWPAWPLIPFFLHNHSGYEPALYQALYLTTRLYCLALSFTQPTALVPVCR
jgi:hypothetical protein